MIFNILRTLAVAALFTAPLTGCPDKKGSAERAGEKAGKALDKAGDNVEEAADKVGDKVEEAAENVEEAVE